MKSFLIIDWIMIWLWDRAIIFRENSRFEFLSFIFFSTSLFFFACVKNEQGKKMEEWLPRRRILKGDVEILT